MTPLTSPLSVTLLPAGSLRITPLNVKAADNVVSAPTRLQVNSGPSGIGSTLSVARTRARIDVQALPEQPFGRKAADNDLMSAMLGSIVQSGLPFAFTSM